MVAIKIDEIGNSQVRLSARMNAQNKKGKSIIAKVNCQNVALPKLKKIRVKSGSTHYCDLGPISVCGSPQNDDGVVVNFENQTGKMLGFEPCVPAGLPRN